MSKHSKLRTCPALGHEITPADCGEQRQNRITCPADCLHNPFNPVNYSQSLEIEARFDNKNSTRFMALEPDAPAMMRKITQSIQQGIQGYLDIQAQLVWRLFFAKNVDKTTFAQRWEKAGAVDLKNDERIMLRGKMQIRVGLLEIHRILDENRVEAVDLLSPQPTSIQIVDRSLAGSATRFATTLSFIYPMPHYWRISGIGLMLPDVARLTAPEVVREIVKHLGGPVTEAEMRCWLAENFVRCNDALTAVSQARHQQMMISADAKWGKVVYELRSDFASCRKRLDILQDIEPDDLSDKEQKEGLIEAREWLETSSHKKHLIASGGELMLGRVLLGQTHWRIEAFGAEKLARVRELFEQQMGDHVRFTGERVDDLGARLAGGTPVKNVDLVPPRLLENPNQMAMTTTRIPMPPQGVSKEHAVQEMLRAMDQAFLDESVPALENRTPREAARDPSLRPRLIELMKHRVQSHDERNLETGGVNDINWMLHELGLNEIIFDAPPRRPPPKQHPGEMKDWDEPEDFHEPKITRDDSRSPAPPLPAAPLTAEASAYRLQNALNLFELAADADAELQASGATILEDAEDITQTYLTENEFCFAIPFILQCWFALVPCGCRAPEIEFVDLERSFADNQRQIMECLLTDTPKKMDAFIQRCPQPGLMLMLMASFVKAAKKAPKELCFSPNAQPVILALLKSVVETLDEVLRRK